MFKKLKFNYIGFVIAFLFIILSHYSVSQNYREFGRQVNTLFKMLDNRHFSPKPINSKLSNQIFINFIKTIDPNNLYFIRNDIDTLSKYRFLLCNDVELNTSSFFELVCKFYKQRLIQSDSIILLNFDEPFDFSVNESIVLTREDTIVPAKNRDILIDNWRKWLKYKTLQNLSMISGSVEESFLKDNHRRILKDPLIQKRTKIKESREINMVLNSEKGFEDYLGNIYLNCITSSYDPHTTFFSKTAEKEFESSLSTEDFDFGFSFEENSNGEVLVSQLVPGSPAWRSEKLNKGDVILKVKLPNNNEIDLAFSDIHEINNILASGEFFSIELTVRKFDGRIKTVSLNKAKYDTRANKTLSFILNGQKRVGYITFPGFYADLNYPFDKGCASDIYKEIVKLKDEKIDGLIIDLRNNGGGVIKEAVELLKFLLPEGPLYYICRNSGLQLGYENRGNVLIYNGPLAILTNGLSASASEIVTATLQDYNRALIIGDRTYGKATAQNIFPLFINDYKRNRFKSEFNDDNGYVKVTTDKIYRITGKSFQKKGVVPDILLPDTWEFFNAREERFSNALEQDSIIVRQKFNPFSPFPLNLLIRKSAVRLKQDDKFIKIKNINDSINQYLNNFKSIPLDMFSYIKLKKEKQRIYESLEKLISNENIEYEVINNKFDMVDLQTDSFNLEVNEIFLKNIKQDIYIEESYKIMSDFLDYKHN